MNWTRQLGVWIAIAATVMAQSCSTSSRVHPRSERPHPKGPPTAATNSVLLAEEELEQRVKAYAHFAAGVIFDLQEQPSSALEEFTQSALADPENESLVLEVARRHLQSKEPEKSLKVLEPASRSHRASGRIFSWLGLVHSELGDRDQAIAAHQRAIEKEPSLLMPYQALAQIYLQDRQPKEALQVLTEATQQSALEPGFLVDLAQTFLNYHQLQADDSETIRQRIHQILDQAADQKPQQLIVLQKMADSYKALGEFAKAEAIYLQLLDRFPRLPSLREKLTDSYLRSGKKEQAVEQLQAIAREHPTNPRVYYYLGTLAAQEKKYGEAAEYFEKSLLFKDDAEEVYYELAGLKLTLDKSVEALKILDRARAKFSPSFLLDYYTGMAYSRMKKYAEAIKHFTAAEVHARALDPERLNAPFYFQLGAVQERNGDYGQAEKYFRKCLELSPNFAEALNYLGYMWAERGENLKEAQKFIEKAVEIEPGNGAFLDSMAWVLYKQDQAQAALPYLLKALEHVEEPDPTLYDHLGDIYAAVNQLDKAREAWRKSLEIEPNEKVQKKLGSTLGPQPGP